MDNYRGLSFKYVNAMKSIQSVEAYLTVINNSSPNDVVVDKSGNLWFTDEYLLHASLCIKPGTYFMMLSFLHPTYGFLNKLNPKAPQLTTGVWFFNTTSQLVRCVEHCDAAL